MHRLISQNISIYILKLHLFCLGVRVLHRVLGSQTLSQKNKSKA